MLISDIPVGGPISIEISIDNVSYEMPSSVVASKNSYILLAPFTSKGAVIDFSSYKDILFNLYTIDPATKNRVVWKNINIETITYKSTGFASAYYKISTNVLPALPLNATEDLISAFQPWLWDISHQIPQKLIFR